MMKDKDLLESRQDGAEGGEGDRSWNSGHVIKMNSSRIVLESLIFSPLLSREPSLSLFTCRPFAVKLTLMALREAEVTFNKHQKSRWGSTLTNNLWCPKLFSRVTLLARLSLSIGLHPQGVFGRCSQVTEIILLAFFPNSESRKCLSCVTVTMQSLWTSRGLVSSSSCFWFLTTNSIFGNSLPVGCFGFGHNKITWSHGAEI